MNTLRLRRPLVVACCAAVTAGATTINPTHRYAYGANVGWMDARGDVAHGAVVGPHFCSGSVWSANVGWISLGNGPANGFSYSNATATDWGVNHDGAGRLTGYAYGANVGWILFEQVHGMPRVDLLTGDLSGHAWGANIGWISLANSQAFVRTDTLDAGPDSDGDSIPDAWEYEQTGDLATLDPPDPDADDDGIPDTDEYVADTDPLDPGSGLTIVAYDRTGPTNTVTWPASSRRSYNLQYADVLSAAVWNDSGHGSFLGTPGVPELTRAVVDPASTQRFFRVQVRVPLTP